MISIYKWQIDLLFRNPRVRQGLVQTLSAVPRHADGIDLTLAYRCTHFARCYGLNRFLVLLLLRFAAEAGLPIRELPSTGVYSVAGLGHRCGNPWACHGQPHDVQFFSFPNCAMPRNPPHQRQDFDALVLRLGVKPPPPFSGAVPLLITRQILPYHAP